ncbi:MAG: amidohydrolase family protein [Sphingomonadaceae bacterium]
MIQPPQPILFRNARIVDPDSGRVILGELLVAGRVIAAIGQGLAVPANTQIVEAGGRVLAPGLVDAGAFRSDIAAAVAGGFTSVILMPDQAPPLDDPALVERAERLGKPRLWVRPLAAATRGLLGRELAEIGLMREAGAVGVATGRAAIADSAVMLRLLRYAAGLNMVTVCHPEDPALVHGAVATEAEYATRLGLPAAPAAAEAIQISRDLRLAREAGAAVHFATVTTAEGVALIAAAKRDGQDVTAATTPEAFLLNDIALAGYRSYVRLSPPLRVEEDRLAVRAGVADGTIDMIVSRHDPQTEDAKRQPFTEATPGAAGQALLLALALTLVHDGVIDLPRLFTLTSLAPARRFGLSGGRLAEGAAADILLLNPDSSRVVDADTLPGLAGNTPFDGLPVSGRVEMLIKGGEIMLHDIGGSRS